jgi:hypothetical protein
MIDLSAEQEWATAVILGTVHPAKGAFDLRFS